MSAHARRFLIGLAALSTSSSSVYAGKSFLLSTVPNWVADKSAVDCRFIDNQCWQQVRGITTPFNALTTVRAAPTAYAATSGGVYYPFGANVPRITNAGLLIEESRTNSIRNNMMIGAVTGAIGSGGAVPTNWINPAGVAGTPYTIIAIPTVSGAICLDVGVSGTTNLTEINFNLGENAPSTVTAASGQTWAGSVITRILLDDANITNYFVETLAMSGVTEINRVSTSFTSTRLSTTRVSAVVTGGSGTNNVFHRMRFAVPNSTAVNFRFRVCWPQLELGFYTTSPIPTSGATVTRAADVITVTKPPVFGNGYTLYGAGTSYANDTGGITAKHLIAIDDGTLNNRFVLDRNYVAGPFTNGNMFYNVGGSQQVNIQSPLAASGFDAWPTGTFNRTAASTTRGSQAIVLSGQAIGVSGVATTPFVPTIVHIGVRSDSANNSQFGGYLARVALWPTVAQPSSYLRWITSGSSP